MEVIGSQYSTGGTVGDFNWMIEQSDYADALFIFNDNEEHFRAYMDDPSGTAGCGAGGGNAIIRPYRCAIPPRAAGIPTGVNNAGYPMLTDSVRVVLDEAFGFIKGLLASGLYKRVFYSAANAQGDLGTSIYNPGQDVKTYIVAGLRKFGQMPPGQPAGS